MIVKKFWTDRDDHSHEKYWCGWFLFGTIPLYVKQIARRQK